eukprot:147003_1
MTLKCIVLVIIIIITIGGIILLFIDTRLTSYGMITYNSSSATNASIKISSNLGYKIKVAFVARSNAFRFGGGEYYNITKKLFGHSLHENLTINIGHIIKSNEFKQVGSTNTIFTEHEWCVCTMFWGWIDSWNADIIYIESYNEHFNYIELLSEYNLLISHDMPFRWLKPPTISSWNEFDIILKNMYNKTQYRFKVFGEPQWMTDLRSRFIIPNSSNKYRKINKSKFIDNMNIEGIFPVLIDSYSLRPAALYEYDFTWEGIPDLPKITLHYRYQYTWMNNIVNNCVNNETKSIIYLTQRCNFKCRQINRWLKYNKTFKGIKYDNIISFNEMKIHYTYNEFLCVLSNVKMVYNSDALNQAGQTICTAAIYGIPVFGHSQKYMQSALMPRWLFVDELNYEQIIEKMIYLIERNTFYQQLKIEIKQRAKELFLYNKYSPNDLINDAYTILNAWNNDGSFDI